MTIPTTFMLDQRVAIGELIEMGALCNESSNEAVLAIGAIALEHAAAIVRGEATPKTFTDEDVNAFAAFWNAEERAEFNQPDPPGRLSTYLSRASVLSAVTSRSKVYDEMAAFD